MAGLTELLGFQARYLVYPFLSVLAAAIAWYVIHRYAKKWVQRTETKIDDHIVGYLDSALVPVLLMSILYLFSYWFPLPEASVAWIQKGLRVLILGVVVFSLVKISGLLIGGLGAGRPAMRRFARPLRTLATVGFVLVGIGITLRVLNVNLTSEGIGLVRIVGIAVGAFVALRILNLAVAQMERLVERRDAAVASEAEKRVRTIGKIIKSVGLALVLGTALMMILSELGMNIAPIITGAGIAGLAVGFGAQNLVRDIISGFFLILEDQVRVGDVAVINSTGGLVEAIRLRTTVLRDLEGVVHIFPNGEIKQVSNMTKGFSYSVIDVGVAYEENVDKVMDVLREIGGELAADPKYAALILEPLDILGVDALGASQVTIKIRIKTLPLQQWAVGRELRRRIKNTFDQKGIEIPFPQMTVRLASGSDHN